MKIENAENLSTKILPMAKYYLGRYADILWARYESKGIEKFEQEHYEIYQIINALQELQNFLGGQND